MNVAAEKSFEVRVQGDIDRYRAGDRTVVFHGVNKSGSLAMSNVIRGAYVSADRANQFFSHYHGIPRNAQDVKDLINHSTGHSFVVGHYLYGAVKPDPQRIFVSMFRHPLPRIISCYQWLKNKSVAAGGAPEDFPSVEDFVTKTGGIGHSQIVQFGIGYGRNAKKLRARLTREQILQRAKRNIERDIVWFGISEYFEESIYVLAAICGLPRVPPWQRDTRNKGRKLIWDVDPGIHDVIRDVYRCDFELYDHALGIFRDRISRLEILGDFEEYQAYCAGQYKDRLVESAPAHETAPALAVT
jgi:hypothetical protein